jgi:hypothetical protein
MRRSLPKKRDLPCSRRRKNSAGKRRLKLSARIALDLALGKRMSLSPR